MSTLAQIQANQENAKLSTGPRTEAGKAVSSRKHLVHGLCSTDPVLPTEDRNEFNQLVDEIKAEWQPATAHTKFLVQEMAEAQWKLARINRIENDMLAQLDDPSKIYFDTETAARFARLERHRAALQRNYHRCARALDTWHKGLKHIEAKFRQLSEKASASPFRSPIKTSLSDFLTQAEQEIRQFKIQRMEARNAGNPENPAS